VLVAAILKGDWKMAGEMMVRDVFHHPYRADMVPGLEEMLSGIRQYGAYGAALSGAGPTILCFVPSGRGEEVKRAIQEDYPDFRVETAKPAPFGSNVHYVNQPAGVSGSV
jgi:homoserine kinase